MIEFLISLFIVSFPIESGGNFKPVITEHRFLRIPSAEEPPPKKKVGTTSCAIAWSESSYHQFRVHDYVNRGVNKGTRSVSSYGMMPLTVKEMLNTGFKDTETGKLVSSAKTMKQINDITRDRYHDDIIFEWHWKLIKARVSKIVNIANHRRLVTVLAHYAGVTGSYKYYQKNGFDGVKNHWYVKKFLYNLSNRC
jgi:hypothetical protein